MSLGENPRIPRVVNNKKINKKLQRYDIDFAGSLDKDDEGDLVLYEDVKGRYMILKPGDTAQEGDEYYQEDACGTWGKIKQKGLDDWIRVGLGSKHEFWDHVTRRKM